jgi:hypothetical protein
MKWIAKENKNKLIRIKKQFIIRYAINLIATFTSTTHLNNKYYNRQWLESMQKKYQINMTRNKDVTNLKCNSRSESS